jgi:hypothetical protein
MLKWAQVIVTMHTTMLKTRNKYNNYIEVLKSIKER